MQTWRTRLTCATTGRALHEEDQPARGLKDRTLAEKALAEEYMLKQIIQAAVNRESSRANAEALRNRPTGNVNRLDKVEGHYQGGSINTRINHLQAELEDMTKLRQVGKYNSRHKSKGEKEQCPR